MLFSEKNAEMVLAGKKTQTRRNPSGYYRKDMLTRIKTSTDGPTLGWIRIKSVRSELLGEISLADVRAEGCESVAEYQRVYLEIYGIWDNNKLVEVIDFELSDYKPGDQRCRDK